MLRDIKHISDDTHHLGNYGLGNRPSILDKIPNATTNTITFWFKESGMKPAEENGKFASNYFELVIKQGFSYGDESGVSEYIIKGDYFLSTTATYYTVICKNKSTVANFHIELDKSKVPHLLGLRVITLNPEMYNEYEFTYKTGYQFYKFTHIETSITENYKEYLPIEPGIQYNAKEYINNGGRAGLLPFYNKSWVFQDTQNNLLGSKSIAIPKWLDYITIEATGIKAPNNPEKTTPFKCISYDGVNNLADRIKLFDVNHYSDNIVRKTNESDLVYDGEDYRYRYYHIVSVTNDSTANNLLSIIGSVKKNFRVFNQKSNIFYSHLLLNNTILFTKGVTINMLRSPYISNTNTTLALINKNINTMYNEIFKLTYITSLPLNYKNGILDEVRQTIPSLSDYQMLILTTDDDHTPNYSQFAVEQYIIPMIGTTLYTNIKIGRSDVNYASIKCDALDALLTIDRAKNAIRISHSYPIEVSTTWYSAIRNSNTALTELNQLRIYGLGLKKNFRVFGVLLAKNNKSKRIKSSYNNFIKEVA